MKAAKNKTAAETAIHKNTTINRNRFRVRLKYKAGFPRLLDIPFFTRFTIIAKQVKIATTEEVKAK